MRFPLAPWVAGRSRVTLQTYGGPSLRIDALSSQFATSFANCFPLANALCLNGREASASTREPILRPSRAGTPCAWRRDLLAPDCSLRLREKLRCICISTSRSLLFLPARLASRPAQVATRPQAALLVAEVLHPQTVAPNSLFYNCSIHAAMTGKIDVVD